MTRFEYFPLSRVQEAHGVVVVIDVLRAFTTAAYAFDRGAEKILPVSTIAEAFNLKTQFPESLIMGEENGVKPEGFDFGNSPLDISKQNLKNRIIIQRTSAGTQGLTQTKNHRILIAASFVVAGATAEFLKSINPETVSFIITGQSMGRDGDEDRACAEYIERLYLGDEPIPEDFTARILTSTVGQSFMKKNLRYLAEADIEMSSLVNIFDFVMLVKSEARYRVLYPCWFQK
ncbi:MAG: 2-phosphosulfolactate phosphatase [Brevefilum sp.]|nr:2-phosphosulfolactate phosphatase [Brevefilum sp.]MDT8381582.1 2-phosphosulfolactate phosphatase [Brevefilum sp.]MDW7754094.1 2-phosphosulfolactate phosphatase [Brevefilum sp.]